MRRTDEEFKAEVFRRCEEYKRDRRQRLRRIMACCVPLVLIAAVAAVWVPQVFPAIQEGRQEELYNSVEESGDLETVWLRIEVVDGNGETCVLSRETADEILVLFSEEETAFSTAAGVQKENGADNIADTSWSYPPLYEVTVTTESGTTTYKVYETNAYWYDDGADTGRAGWVRLEPETAKRLKELLEQEEGS